MGELIDGVALRRVPAPYRAMLAVTNDVDEATWREFAWLHAFMNTDRETPLGRGLSLEIADSFFFYATSAPGKKPTFSYFEHCDAARPAPWARDVEALIDAGFVDSLHSWGEFSRTGGFTRDLAQSAAPVLARHPGKVPVWINHGDACNEQSAGRPGWDQPSSPHGHADITLGAGLRYFWTATLTSVIGQGADDRLIEKLHPVRLREDWVRPMRRVLSGGPALVPFFGNQLLQTARVRGTAVRAFQRYGFWDKPTADELDDVLGDGVLDALERRGGFMSVYTHLFRRSRSADLRDVDWSPLRRLASRHRAHRILVATTSRLLNYVDLIEQVRWRVARDAAATTEIHVEAPDALPLRGLTFYVPDARRARIVTRHGPAPLERHDPDHTGRQSVSVAWDPLTYPRLAHDAA